MAGSSKMVHWICTNCPKSQQHLFVASLQSHIGLNSGCRFCASKKACICNLLLSLYPLLAAEYDTAKNGFGLQQVLPTSHQMAFWKDASGHTWAQSSYQRTKLQVRRNKRAFPGLDPNINHDAMNIEDLFRQHSCVAPSQNGQS